MKILASALATILLLSVSPASAANEDAKRLKVGLYLSEPFIFDLGNGRYNGLSVDLWEQVAARLDIESEYIFFRRFRDIMTAVKAGEIDMAVGDITVSHERTRYMKFSFPWFDDGLGIMVKSDQYAPSVWSTLKQRGDLKVYAWIIGVTFALTVAQALLRRRRDTEFPPTWLEGMSLSLYEVVRAAKAGQLQKNFMGWAGYLVLTVWMLCGFGLLAYVNSTLTSAMTSTMILHEEINSVQDLSGKRVGVLSHSVAEEYMKQSGARLVVVDTPENAVQALLSDDADAIVLDASELEFWAYKHPKAKVQIVGKMFLPSKYAFAAPKKHAQLMDDISIEVLRLIDNGTVDALKNKYFGKSPY